MKTCFDCAGRAGRPKVVARRDYLNGGARMESYVLKRKVLFRLPSLKLELSAHGDLLIHVCK